MKAPQVLNKPFSCYFHFYPILEGFSDRELAARSIVAEIADMASITMTASLLPTSSSALTKRPSTTARRGLVVVRASSEKASLEVKNVETKEESSGRRELVFAAAAAAAAAACSIAKAAMADEEPKPGTAYAKKKYAPVCVTMPTARICHK